MSDCVLKFPATLRAYSGAFEALRHLLEERGLRGRGRYNVELIFEEIVTNIIRHGEAIHSEPEVELALGFEPEAVVMSFYDDGVPFDPREHAPDELGAVPDARVGGLGIKLVRHASKTIDYERTPRQQNRLTVTVANA
jgi:anti-sigma regulatory factor (Ser/Thr protein kinase)